MGEPKCRFSWAMALILGQSASKDQVVYESEQVGEGSYQATLHAPDLAEFMGDDKIFTGEPAETKKSAEQNAAAVAWAALEPSMQDVIAQHEAKKEKNAESLAKLKKTHEEKKAAAAAAAGDGAGS